jgi:hypothetical protein
MHLSTILGHSGFLFSKFRLTALLLLVFAASTAQNLPAFSVDVCNAASNGYYFISPFSPTQNLDAELIILDRQGRVIYYKIVAGSHSGDFTIQPNGLITYELGSKFYLMDSTFSIVDSVECVNGIQTDNHEFQILPNGHFLMLGYENVSMNLSSYHIFGPNHTLAGNANANVKCGVIQEQDTNHNVVFEWHVKDHFSFADADPYFMNSPLNVDWTHCNALDLDTDGNILLSSRHLDEITKINRSDSSIIWRLGGNANQFVFLNDSAMFLGQHDCRRIANGHLTLNDNGRRTPLHPASAKEYQLDENLHTANLVWSYTEDSSSYSAAVGNFQRLSNGNTVVDNGITPYKNLMFNVVDPSGNKIFQLTFQDTLRTYRAFNYLTLPWQLNRPQVSCFTIGQQLFLDAGPGYSSYLWSNGATTQTIPVSAADTFSVFVPIGSGGFISSDFIIVSDPSTYCVTMATENFATAPDFSVSPNPVVNELHVQLINENMNNLKIEIYNATGEKLISFEKPAGNQVDIDLSGYSSGIYFVLVNGTGKKFMKL